jgi:iron complex outermembrane recepter protein
LLLRASWGKGFRAPTLPDLFTQRSSGPTVLNALFDDPLRCPVTGLETDCGVREYDVLSGGSRDLVPERSRQWAIGVVWEPVPRASISIDYWNIRKTAVIGSLTDDLILGNFDVFGATHVERGPVDPAFPGLPGPIRALIEWKQNIGNNATSGIDVSLRVRSVPLRIGRFAFNLDGTYIMDWVEHLNGLEPRSYEGAYLFAPVPRWRHHARLDWENGPWAATLGHTFQSGYTDANPTPAGESRRVGTYSIFDLQARYSGFKNATIAVGIRNLFDRAPPFTNQRDSFQIGYDPNYADPRGRTFYGRISYAFH